MGDIYDVKNVWNSKTFLPPVCYGSKPEILKGT
jgi:hypothetical protein